MPGESAYAARRFLDFLSKLVAGCSGGEGNVGGLVILGGPIEIFKLGPKTDPHPIRVVLSYLDTQHKSG